MYPIEHESLKSSLRIWPILRDIAQLLAQPSKKAMEMSRLVLAGLKDDRFGPIEITQEFTITFPELPILETAPQQTRKILIYHEFSMMANTLVSVLTVQGIKPFFVNGTHTMEERAATINAFIANTDPSRRVLLFSKVGACGLNLACADMVILYDVVWSDVVATQIIGRAHRMGQLRTVYVYSMVALGTTDVLMTSIAGFKNQMLLSLVARDPTKSSDGDESSDSDDEDKTIDIPEEPGQARGRGRGRGRPRGSTRANTRGGLGRGAVRSESRGRGRGRGGARGGIQAEDQGRVESGGKRKKRAEEDDESEDTEPETKRPKRLTRRTNEDEAEGQKDDPPNTPVIPRVIRGPLELNPQLGGPASLSSTPTAAASLLRDSQGKLDASGGNAEELSETYTSRALPSGSTRPPAATSGDHPEGKETSQPKEAVIRLSSPLRRVTPQPQSDDERRMQISPGPPQSDDERRMCVSPSPQQSDDESRMRVSPRPARTASTSSASSLMWDRPSLRAAFTIDQALAQLEYSASWRRMK